MFIDELIQTYYLTTSPEPHNSTIKSTSADEHNVGDTTEKVKLNLGSIENVPQKYRANIRLLQPGRQNPMILKQEPTEILQMDQVYKEAFGSSNNSSRSTLHRVREELDINMNDEFFS